MGHAAVAAPPAGSNRGYRDLPPTAPVSVPLDLARAISTVAIDAELNKEAVQAYVAWLGFYKGSLKLVGWDPADMVAHANHLFGVEFGLGELPAIPRDTLGKMGLRGVPGIREGPGRSGGGGGGGGRGGFGGGGRGGRR